MCGGPTHTSSEKGTWFADKSDMAVGIAAGVAGLARGALLLMRELTVWYAILATSRANG